MADIPGIDTIRGLAGEPPVTIQVPYRLLETEQVAMQGWNSIYIAIIPYCFKCKEPLTWHSPPKGENLFTCPKCGRIWMKGDDWDD